METLKYWVWLSRIENLNKKKLDILLKKYKTIENLWSAKSEKELIYFGMTKELAEKIVSKAYKKDLNQYIDYMQKNKIELITFDNEKYPTNLRNIYNPPISLYVRGNKDILNEKSIAIIGSRQCTSYGENIAKKFAYNLSKSNINIINGLAKRDRYICSGRVNSCKREDYCSNGVRIRYSLPARK